MKMVVEITVFFIYVIASVVKGIVYSGSYEEPWIKLIPMRCGNARRVVRIAPVAIIVGVMIDAVGQFREAAVAALRLACEAADCRE